MIRNKGLVLLTLSLLISLSSSQYGNGNDGDPCSERADCGRDHFWTCTNHVCEHKLMFPPEPQWEYAGMVVCFVFLVFANMGGTGGGGLIIPFIIVFNDWGPKTASEFGPFFNITAAIVRYCISLCSKSPVKPNKTLIDYDMVCILVPLNLLGIIVGGIVNEIVPGILISAGLFCFLVFVAYKLAVKGRKTWIKESKAKKDLKE